MKQRAKLRKREIGFALAMGVLAAGGGTVILSELHHDRVEATTITERADYKLADFATIASTGPQDVVVTLGQGFAVRAEGSREGLARYEAVVENGELTIRTKAGLTNALGMGEGDDVTFYVTLPRLDAVALAGSGSVQVDRAEGDKLKASVTGSGELTIGQMKFDQADLEVTGSGTLTAMGAVREARTVITGSGDLDGRGLRSDTASITVGGSGDAVLDVARIATVAVTGSGDVQIVGPATCAVTKSGSGEVRCDSDPGNE